MLYLKNHKNNYFNLLFLSRVLNDMSLPILAGLASFIKDYDLVICDIWGVIHNGLKPYPEVLDCLSRLRTSGICVAFLSNAPRPNEKVEIELKRIGINRDYYDILFTSGEATRQHLLRRNFRFMTRESQKFFHLGPKRCSDTVAGVGKEVDMDTADFIVCTGLFDDENEQASDYDNMLQKGIDRSIPLVCANPDLVVMRGEKMIPCAGSVALYYAGLGGRVQSYGKPYPEVFNKVLKLANVGPAKALMIGDGLETDIRGARESSIDSLWIAGGINARDVEYKEDGELREEVVKNFVAHSGESPRAVMGRLRW